MRLEKDAGPLGSQGVPYGRLHSRKRDFKGWERGQLNDAIVAVVDLIVRYDVHGVAAGVLLPEYAKVVKGRARVEVGTPWHLCLRTVLLTVSERADRLPPGEWVAFVCDLQQEYAPEAAGMYERIDQTPNWPNRKRLGSFTFDTDATSIGLQVADVLAYETFRHMDNTVYSNRTIRRSMDRLVHERPFYGTYYDHEALAELAGRHA
jgi:hypothetical protein